MQLLYPSPEEVTIVDEEGNVSQLPRPRQDDDDDDDIDSLTGGLHNVVNSSSSL